MLGMSRINSYDLGIRIPQAMKDALDAEVAKSEARMAPVSISDIVRTAVVEYLERKNPVDEARTRRELAVQAEVRASRRRKTSARQTAK